MWFGVGNIVLGRIARPGDQEGGRCGNRMTKRIGSVQDSDLTEVLLPDKGRSLGQSISLFWRNCADESLTGSDGDELFAGYPIPDRGRRVIVRGKLDDDRCVLREISNQSRILGNPEFVVEISKHGPVRLVDKHEMAAQILVFLFVGRRRRLGGSAVDLSVEVVWNVLAIPLLGKAGDVLGEDVIESFEVLRGDGIERERDRDGELWVRIGGQESVKVGITSDGSRHPATWVHGYFEVSKSDYEVDVTIWERRPSSRDRHTFEEERVGHRPFLLSVQRRSRQR